MKISIVFTGQGAQKVGMGKDFYESYNSVKELFAKADETLGFNLSKIIFEGPEEELKKTSITQPAILLISYAFYRIFKEELKDLNISYFSGHSLGEYTAITAGGAIDILDALKLVRKRGELMESVSDGGMAAVIGMDKNKLIDVILKYNVEAVNFNSPRQIVIAGKVEDLKRAEIELKNNGARRVVMLDVSGAFHSSYMKDVKKEFSEYLDAIELKKPSSPVVCNFDGKEHTDPSEIKNALKEQIASPVLWVDSVNYMISQGVSSFLEFGPSKVLGNLILQINKDVKTYSVYDMDSYKEVVSVFKG